MPIIYFLLVFFFTIYEWQKSRTDVEKKKAQLEMNSLHYETYAQLIQLIRERQHDLKNHINAILSMIYTTDNYEELARRQTEYCGYVTEENEDTDFVLSVENPILIGFLHGRKKEAEKKEIEVDYQMEAGEKDIEATGVLEYELVEMLGILFDNALEALSMEEQSQPKKIRISIKKMERGMEFAVANTSIWYGEDVTELFFEEGYSSKGSGRGIGLSKLKRMVHERNGDVVVSSEKYDGDGYLQFGIILPLGKLKIKEKRQKS